MLYTSDPLVTYFDAEEYMAVRSLLYLTWEETMNPNVHWGVAHLKRLPAIRMDADINDKEQTDLRNRHQRLLLHASVCPQDNGRCFVYFCWGMKALWRHLMICRKPDCHALHCASSKIIMSQDFFLRKYCLSCKTTSTL
jgi:hypothetical protein